MILVFFILIVLVCFILGLVVLVQNPKGGGLSGTFGGFNNQFMGVKQTTDVLEKGTWLFAAILGFLCIISTLFFKGSTGSNVDVNKLPSNSAPVQQQPAPNNATPLTPQAPK